MPFFGFVERGNRGITKEGGVLLQNSLIIKYSKKGRKLFIMEFTKIEMLKNILREVGASASTRFCTVAVLF